MAPTSESSEKAAWYCSDPSLPPPHTANDGSAHRPHRHCSVLMGLAVGREGSAESRQGAMPFELCQWEWGLTILAASRSALC
jgi:hypothetical protein